MRPLRPFCATVLKAQLLTLPATISTSANGVVTTQLSFLPPASSSATDVSESSESRPATAQPPEPPPTTTKSNVSVTNIPPPFYFRLVLAATLRFCRVSGKGGSQAAPGPFWRPKSLVLAATKSSKAGLWPFPKQACVGTYAPHPMGFARGRLLRKPPDGI